MDFKCYKKNMETLITFMQERDYLYSVRYKEYMDRVKEAQAFIELQEILEPNMVGVTVAAIKNKWKALRSQYIRELRQIKNSKKSRSERSELYVPKLWCFNQLSFLEPHACIRDSQDNIEAEATSEQGSSTSIADESCFSPNKEPCPKRVKKSNPFLEIRKGLRDFRKCIERKKKQIRKYDWLGKLVAAQMEEVNVEYQQKVAWEIQSVIQKYISISPKPSTSNRISSRDLPQMSMEEKDFST